MNGITLRFCACVKNVYKKSQLVNYAVLYSHVHKLLKNFLLYIICLMNYKSGTKDVDKTVQ